MTGVVDADTHVAESLSMWNLMDAEMRHRRPILLSMPDDTLYKDWNVLWLIDGNIFPKPVGKGGFRLITPSEFKIQSSRKDIRVACREITDVDARLADMDRLGVEIQVIYPTLFLIYLTDDRSWTSPRVAPTTALWRKPALTAKIVCAGCLFRP